jgi:hypothetical protein
MEMARAAGGLRAPARRRNAWFAETKDHQNWWLIGQCAKKAKGDLKKALAAAHEEWRTKRTSIYHTTGWSETMDRFAGRGRAPPPRKR